MAAISAVAYANDNGAVQVNWQIAGPILGDIQLNDNAFPGNYPSLSLSAKGSPGNSEIQAAGAAEWAPFDGQCSEDTNLQLKFINGAFVALFPDQSMLFFVVYES